INDVTLAWDTLTPDMAPPEETGSLYPLFDSDDFAVGDNGYFLPALSGWCCWNPGDFNGDKVFNISDVTAGIAFIFSGGDPPLCHLEADFDGSGAFGIGDVTAGIAFIFSGGPGPICP
ncbi:MAG TPA: hypothetical protein VLB27_10790, partial [candidate division Zixibacteria bacterium]|nr:hypothetical protein [candidate division Zixibacteria bacterium]